MSEPQTSNGTSEAAPLPIPQPVSTTPIDAPPIVAPATAGAVDDGEIKLKGNNLLMPREALNKRLASASAKGKREALAEFEVQAQASGFKSLQDMFGFVGNMKSQTQGKQQPKAPPKADAQEPGQPRDPARETHRWQRQLEQEKLRTESERRGRIGEERKRKDLERRTEELEAEMAIRQEAVRAGVTDVDYAVTLMRRDLEGKSPAELKGFDEAKYFEALRQSRPHLFSEVVRPVTTGNGSGNHPSTPSPAAVTGQAAQNGRVNVRDMKPKEYQDMLRKRGITPS